MKRQGRILGLALKNAGILQLSACRKLNFDSSALMEDDECDDILKKRLPEHRKRPIEAEERPMTNRPNDTEEFFLESENDLSCMSNTEPLIDDTFSHRIDVNDGTAPTYTELLTVPPSTSDETHNEDTGICALPETGTFSTVTSEPSSATVEIRDELPTVPLSTSDETHNEDSGMCALPETVTSATVNSEPSSATVEIRDELQTVPLSTSNETHNADAGMCALPETVTFSTVNSEPSSAKVEIRDDAVPSTSKDQPVVTTNQKSSSRRRRERRAKLKKQHLDYLSDDEVLLIKAFGDCDEDSDLWTEGSGSADSTDNEDKGPRKKRQKRSGNAQRLEEHGMVGELGVKHKKKNKRHERQKLKNSGQEYTKSNGELVHAKTVLPNPCHGKKCGNDCGSITEERRQCIFDHYWKLTPERRRDWLVSLSQRNSIKRKRNAESTKRNVTYQYFINEGEGKKPVCLQFLASTVAISHKAIYYTVSNAVFGTAKEDLRGKCEPPNKTKEATRTLTHNFIKSLPAVPSHRCGGDSTRVYLPQEYKNLTNLYKIYRHRYSEEGIDYVSEKIFRHIFTDDYNIGFHVPKKDKCKKCLNYENDPSLEAEKLKHEDEKKRSFDRFKFHQNVHNSSSNTLCVSFDLEKVLKTPHGQSMLLYYSRKIAVYNLCFYESNTRNVYCFYWDEMNGKRGANEIASILNTYIKMVDNRGTVKHLLLYCDCCPGQNRNKTVLSMIHSTLQSCKSLKTVQINYLLTGHTYMPVDSVHAVIERNIKNTMVYAPSQWYTVFSTARQNPMPYKVQMMTHKDFMKWDIACEKYFKGNLTGKISKIRIATLKKKDASKITVKYSMNESDESIPVEVQCQTKIMPTACYKNLLPISKAKYNDLSRLCKDKVIPTIFHSEFLSIPSVGTVKDTLAESDIEDSDDEM